MGLIENPKPFYIICVTQFLNSFMFLGFLLILKCAQQIIQPYNEEHDVFELSRILDEKLEVAAFILNKDCDLNKKMKEDKENNVKSKKILIPDDDDDNNDDDDDHDYD